MKFQEVEVFIPDFYFACSLDNFNLPLKFDDIIKKIKNQIKNRFIR